MELQVSSFLLTVMYFLSGLEKFTKLPKVAKGLKNRTVGEASSLPLSLFVFTLILSSSLIVIAPIAIVWSTALPKGDPRRKWGVYSCYALIGFTVLATIIYHRESYYPIVSNITAIGGLLTMSQIL